MSSDCIDSFLRELEDGMPVLLERIEFSDDDVPAILGAIAKMAKRKRMSFRVMWNLEELIVQV